MTDYPNLQQYSSKQVVKIQEGVKGGGGTYEKSLHPQLLSF